MNLTPTETSFVIWAFIALLGVLGFIGGLGVNALIKMARDLNEIKTTVVKIDTKHDALEARVTKLEKHGK